MVFAAAALPLICIFLVYGNDLVQYGRSFFGGGDDGRDIRGGIYDSNNKELAVSLDKVSLYARIREVSSCEEVAQQLAPLIGKDENEILSMLRTDASRVWLAKNLDRQQEDALKALHLKGVYLHHERRRYYPRREEGAHLLGFVEEGIGLSGVERYYDKILNEYGVLHSLESLREEKIEEYWKGKDESLFLTADFTVQRILENYLKTLSAFSPDARSGAILMDSKTGDIIALAHYPSFDPNRFHNYKKHVLDNSLAEPVGIPQELRNLLRDAALLQSQYENFGVDLPWSILSQEGTAGNRTWLQELHGSLELDFVSRENVFEGRVRLLSPVAEALEAVPEVTTPLHLLMALGRLVNGGVRVIPHAVDRFKSRWGKNIFVGEESQKKTVGETMSREFLRLLESQAAKGPMGSGFFEGQSVSRREEKGVGNVWRNTLMISLIPVEEPELILLVSVNENTFGPGNKQEILPPPCVSHAKKIIAPMLALHKAPKNPADAKTVSIREKINYQAMETLTKTPARRNGKELERRLKIMPALSGLSLRKSLRMLQELKLSLHIEGTGRVISQMPEAGVVMGSVGTCRLVLKRSPS